MTPGFASEDIAHLSRVPSPRLLPRESFERLHTLG
jgi:hypothetical protein